MSPHRGFWPESGLGPNPLDNDDDDDDPVELVVQGKEIVVSEKLLCEHSLYFAHVFGRLSPEDETVVLRHGR